MTASGSSGLAGHGFRPDIQGLRAVAVLLVLIYHVWPTVLPGGYIGVDVFFVISGYLITGLLLREYESAGRISLWRFYARRLHRLLPAATITLVAVAIATVLLLPEIFWRDIAIEIAASTLYVENWWLAHQAVDYLAEDAVASPLRHYWSLSVEEQFYIVWPWAIAGLVWLASRPGGHFRGRVAVGLSVVVVASLAHSAWLTHREPGIAYFATTTRVWELGLGALLAAVAWRAPARAGTVLGLGGMVMILAAALVLDGETAFPGVAALLPVMGAALLLAAGSGGARRGVWPVLTSRPAVFVGDISYSLYLWHWPLIVFYRHVMERSPDLGDGLLLIVGSIVLAWTSRKLVEEPALRIGRAGGKAIRSYAIGAACISISLGVAALLLGSVGDGRTDTGVAAVVASAEEAAVGAGVMRPGYLHRFVPALTEARKDVPDVGMACHAGLRDRITNRDCVLGRSDARFNVVLVGDSHAWHWAPALFELLEPLDMRLHLMTKSACPFTTATLSRDRKAYEECREWNEQVIAYIEALRPGFVISGASSGVAALREPGQSSADLVARGFLPLWERIRQAGGQVVVLRDTPRFSGPGGDPVRCLARENARLADCIVRREDAVKSEHEDPAMIASKLDPAAHLIDMNDSICNPHTCEPVVGGVLVLRDSHHLTATYARSMAPALGEQLRARLNP